MQVSPRISAAEANRRPSAIRPAGEGHGGNLLLSSPYYWTMILIGGAARAWMR